VVARATHQLLPVHSLFMLQAPRTSILHGGQKNSRTSASQPVINDADNAGRHSTTTRATYRQLMIREHCQTLLS